jgi:ActR/RegA family two-component response regulator
MKRRRVGKRRAQDRELALAYLAVPSVDEVRLDRVIDEHIKRILDATDGNLSLAADLLGMHRRSLQRYARRRKIRPKRKIPPKRKTPPKRKRRIS